MIDPSLAIRNAVYAALMGVLSPKVFYRVPPKTALPYVEISDIQVIGDANLGGGDFHDAHVEVRVFAMTLEEAMIIGGKVFTALNVMLTMDDPATCHEVEHEQSRYWDDGGEVFTGMISFRYWVQTAV